MSEINLECLKEIEEFRKILELSEEGKAYLEEFSWCKRVVKCWYDFGLYDKLGVFLYNIEPANKDIDDYIWIIIGDLPTVYLDKSVQNGHDALKVYCDLMSEWIDNVKNGKSLEDCYPIPVDPSFKNAELLQSRINFIRKELF